MYSLIYYQISLILGCLTALASGIFVFIRNKKSLVNRTWLCTAFTSAMWSLGYFVMISSTSKSLSWWSNWFLHAFAIFIPAFHFHFVVALTEDKKEKRSIISMYLISVILFLINPSRLFIQDVIPKFIFNYCCDAGPLYISFAIYFVTAVLYSWYLLIRAIQKEKGLRSLQLKYFFLSSLFGFTGGGQVFFLTFNVPLPPMGIILFGLYPLVVWYAIARYRLMDIRLVFTKAMAFAIAALPILVIPYVISTKAKSFLARYLGENWWYLPMTTAIVLTYAAIRAYLYIDRKTKELILKKEHDYQRKITNLSQEILHVQSFDELYKLIERAHSLESPSYVDYLSLYLLKREEDAYTLRIKKSAEEKNIREVVTKDNALITLLTERCSSSNVHSSKKDYLLIDELRNNMQKPSHDVNRLKNSEAQMRVLNAHVIFPIWNEKQGQLLGFLSLGEKRSGWQYSDDDLLSFITLTNQILLGITNIQISQEIADRSEQKGVEHTSVGASHQMKNILAKVSVNAEAVYAEIKYKYSKMDDITLEKAKAFISFSRDCMEKILQETTKGTEALDAILYPAKAKENFALLDISALIKQALISSSQIKSKDILQRNIPAPILTNSVPEDFPHIVGNEKLLEQIFENLINNAFDAILWRYAYLKSDSSYRGKITITAEDKGNTITINVEDNGIGMKDETKEKLFAGFFTTKSVERKGDGAGLYSMQGWIKQHKGNITFTSEYGKGTTFTVELPKKQEGF